MTETQPREGEIGELVVRVAGQVFHSDAPITLQSRLADDLLASPVDILDLCRRLQPRLDIALARDELLSAIKAEPRACTLLWLSRICEERRARRT